MEAVLDDEDIVSIVSYLNRMCKIRSYPDMGAWSNDFDKLVPPAVAREYLKSCERAQKAFAQTEFGEIPYEIEESQINFQAQQPLFGLEFSKKWSYILDAMAQLRFWARKLGLQGPVLEMGGFNGYMGWWMARKLRLSVLSIDRNKVAVNSSKKLLPPNPTFKIECCAVENLKPAGPLFEFAFAIDAFPLHPEKFKAWFAKACQLVAEGGHFLIIGNLPNILSKEEVNPLLQANHMSFVSSDLTGGFHFVDGDFHSKKVLLLRKGPGPGFEGEWKSTDWTAFAQYCNSGEHEAGYMNQTLFRYYRENGQDLDLSEGRGHTEWA